MEYAASGSKIAGEGVNLSSPPAGSSPARMATPIRIVTFNVNGLRAVLQRLYGPTGTIPKFLDDVGSKADIICLQETKLRRSELTAASHQLASADGWDSFFSCSNSSRGYSGTATFCRTDKTLPFAAELGFSGLLNNDDTFTPTAAAATAEPSSSSPTVHQELLTEFSIDELRNLDSEGRVVVTDHGAFILFNIYAPAVTKEDPEQAKARLAFKMRFYTALQRRWEALLAAGRAVIVVGDMNIAPAPLDYPDFDPDFYRSSRPDRLWLRSLLSPEEENNFNSNTASGGAGGSNSHFVNSTGTSVFYANNTTIEAPGSREGVSRQVRPVFTDCFRTFFPDRKHAYTVWSTATGARSNNYGSRIDLTLAAGLYVGKEPPDRWIVNQTIVAAPPPPLPLPGLQNQQQQQQQIRNNDVYICAADIEPTVQGSDHCPAWLEVKLNPNRTNNFSRTKNDAMAAVEKEFPCAHTPPPCAMRFCGKQTKLHNWLAMGKGTISTANNKTEVKAIEEESGEDGAGAGAGAAAAAAATQQQKQPSSPPPVQISNRPKQMSLKAFMKVSSPTTTASTPREHLQQPMEPPPAVSIAAKKSGLAAPAAAADGSVATISSTFLQAELQAAAAHQKKQLFAAKGAWQAIQQRMQAPMCLHNDPAALKKVNKSGPNQGRYFYMCARGKGQGPNAQCSFFKWVERKPGDAPRTTMNNNTSSRSDKEGSAKRFKN